MVHRVVPIASYALSLFLKRGRRTGIAIRASAENPDAARAGRHQRSACVDDGVGDVGRPGALTVVLVNPCAGRPPGSDSPPRSALALLLRALAAALVGADEVLPAGARGRRRCRASSKRCSSSTLANREWSTSCCSSPSLSSSSSGAQADRGSATRAHGRCLAKSARYPTACGRSWWVRRLGWLGGGVSIGRGGPPLVFFTDAADHVFLFTRTVLFALIAVSLTVLTGWAGQLSLGQFAFVGLGAFGDRALVPARGMPFGIAVFYGTVVAASSRHSWSGAPALRVQGSVPRGHDPRIRGGCARVAVHARTILGDDTVASWTADSSAFARPRVPQRTYYYLCLAVLVLIVIALTQTPADRDRPDAHRGARQRDGRVGFTVSPAVAKLGAFAVAGGLAALAGGLFAGAAACSSPQRASGPRSRCRSCRWPSSAGSARWPARSLGAVYVVGLPALFDDTAEVGLLTSGIGLLVLLLYLPGRPRRSSSAGCATRSSTSLAATAARRRWRRSPPRRVTTVPARQCGLDRAEAVRRGHPPLDGDGVAVRFGGSASLDVSTSRPGPVRSSASSDPTARASRRLNDVIGGFVRPTTGRSRSSGSDVTSCRRTNVRGSASGAFPGRSPLRRPDGPRDGEGRARSPRTQRARAVAARLPAGASRRAAQGRRADELIDVLGLGTLRRHVIARALDGHASHRRAGVPRRAGHRAAPARRADRGCRAEGDRGVRPADQAHPARARRDGPDHRARHPADHVDLRTAWTASAPARSSPRASPRRSARDPEVIAAYLGTDERAIRRSGSACWVKSAKRGARR